MSTPKQTTQADARWLFTIDLLRGVAAMAVVMYHAHILFWRSPVYNIFEGRAHDLFTTRSAAEIITYLMMGFGYLGVSLFFVISGFCIHLPLAGSNSPLRLGPYAIRRFLRLYPLYFVVMCAAMALQWMHEGFGGVITVGNFLGHMVFWYYNVPPSAPVQGISMVFWSIAVEVHFYVLYALLLPVIRRTGFGTSVLVGLAFGLACNFAWAYFTQQGYGVPRPLKPVWFAPARFGEWLLGAWIAEGWVRGTLPKVTLGSLPGMKWVLLGLSLVAAAIAVVIVLEVDREWINMPASIGFAMILMGLLVRERALGVPERTLLVRLGTWVGDRSYSLYLVHLTVLTVAVEVVFRLTHAVDKNALGGTPTMFVGVLGGLVVAFIVTDLTYRLIERPSHRLGRELGRRASGKPAVQPTPPHPAAAPVAQNPAPAQ